MGIPFSSPTDKEDSRKSWAKNPKLMEINFYELNQSSRLCLAAMAEALDILQTIVSDPNQQIFTLNNKASTKEPNKIR